MSDSYNASSELVSWVAERLNEPVPTRRGPKSAIKIRRWDCPRQPSADAASFLTRRHPALCDLFPAVPEIKIGPSGRSWSRGLRCRFYSWKAQSTLRLDSTLEMDHAANCEVDPDVTRIVPHPFSIKYTLLGKERSYTPDIFTIENGKMKAGEVKMEADAARPENELRWPRIARSLNDLGIDFEVFTDASIRNSTHHQNAKLILAHRMATLPECHIRMQICEYVVASGGTNAKALMERFSLSFDVLLALTRQGFISVDISRPVDHSSTFTRGHRPKADPVREEMFHAKALV